MSHKTTVSDITIDNVQAFMEACKTELGIQDVVDGRKTPATVHIWDGKNITNAVASATVNQNGRKYSIGLVENEKNPGQYNLVGDFSCFGWAPTGKMREYAGVSKDASINANEVQRIVKDMTLACSARAKLKKMAGYRSSKITMNEARRVVLTADVA